MRRHYLICYDIADDRRRTRTHDMLRDNGERVQFSVFLCELTVRELALVRGQLHEFLNHREDQALILDLGPASISIESGMQCVGKPFDPQPRAFIV